jgi:hypothetical protein
MQKRYLFQGIGRLGFLEKILTGQTRTSILLAARVEDTLEAWTERSCVTQVRSHKFWCSDCENLTLGRKRLRWH